MHPTNRLTVDQVAVEPRGCSGRNSNTPDFNFVCVMLRTNPTIAITNVNIRKDMRTHTALMPHAVSQLYCTSLLAAVTLLYLTIPTSASVLPLVSHASKTVAGDGPLFLSTINIRPHPFVFAGCTPSGTCKCDVCGMIAETGSFAPVETRIFAWLGSRECSHEGPTGLVVVCLFVLFNAMISYTCAWLQHNIASLQQDVGANAGYFTSLSIAMGCAVLSLEPSSLVGSLLQVNIALNRHRNSKVQMMPVAVGAVKATAMPSTTDASWGLVQFKVCVTEEHVLHHTKSQRSMCCITQSHVKHCLNTSQEVDKVSEKKQQGGGIEMMPLSSLVPKDRKIMLLKIGMLCVLGLFIHVLQQKWTHTITPSHGRH